MTEDTVSVALIGDIRGSREVEYREAVQQAFRNLVDRLASLLVAIGSIVIVSVLV